jgi:hypothetical protein
MYLLKAVEFFKWALVKLLLWLLNLVLNVGSVKPMYVSLWLVSEQVTVAWYTMQVVRQLPSRGHSD